MPAIKVYPDKFLADMSTFYGIFFEDISSCADGGLYGELICNRGFEYCAMDHPDYSGFSAWKKMEPGTSKVIWSIGDRAPLSAANPHYLALSLEQVDGWAGVCNTGFFTGIPVGQGEEYQFSFYARTKGPMELVWTLLGEGGEEYARGTCGSETVWTQHSFSFRSPVTDAHCRMAIGGKNKGTLHLDLVSLFPKNTFRGENNGLRRDLAEFVGALSPRFMRFPGGCVVHVGTLNESDRNTMYRWKQTVGEIKDRPVKSVRWRGNQTRGLGYFEFFRFCEDVGAEPIPVLPAGYDPHTGMCAPLDEMGEWIQDALDLVEYANGPVNSRWGAVRAAAGHPESFCLKYIAIGNEEEGAEFWDRYDLIHAALREKYPDIRIINNAGPNLTRPSYAMGWENARRNGSDLVDEHYYASPKWLLENCHHYDVSERSGPGTFVGEYSSFGNTYICALSEAAYMIHMENNADVVKMACYAPLLCNTNNSQWKANLIYFDQTRIFGTPNYWVQRLFSNYTGRTLVQTELTGTDKVEVGISFAGKDSIAETENLHATASVGEAGEVYLKVVNPGNASVATEISIEGMEQARCRAEYLAGIDKLAVNTLDDPMHVSPKTMETVLRAGAEWVFPPESVTVFKMERA